MNWHPWRSFASAATLSALLLAPHVLDTASTARADPATTVRQAPSTWTPVFSQHNVDAAACSDVLFVGVRGSGETADEYEGYGRVVTVVRDGFRAATDGTRRVTQVALDYPANSITSDGSRTSLQRDLDLLFDQLKHFVPPTRPAYFHGVDLGVAQLTRLVQDRGAKCPDERVVIAGYSQGAWVANIALSSHIKNQDNIAGVALVADPGRGKGGFSPTRTLGTVARTSGIGTIVRPVIIGDSTMPVGSEVTLPKSLEARTISVCASADPVCATGTDPWAFSTVVGSLAVFLADTLPNNIDRHLTYGAPAGSVSEYDMRRIGTLFHQDLGPTFVDVSPENQFYREISWLSWRGIVSGYPGGSFRPLEPVNRDAMAAFLYRMAGSPPFTPPPTSPFADVAPSNQFYKEIAWMENRKISTGWLTQDGKRLYAPYQPVARDAMAAFLYRFAGSPPLVSLGPNGFGQFVDVPSTSQFSREVEWLSAVGLSTGWVSADGTREFRPLSPIARDAMAAFLFRLHENDLGSSFA